MDFSSFYGGVSQAWGQLWPSLSFLAIAAAAISYCFPKSFGTARDRLVGGLQKAKDTNSVRDFLVRIGAQPAYPVLVAILALVALDVVYGTIAAIAEWLPPNLICLDSRIAYQQFVPSDLALLTRIVPDSDSFEAAYTRGKLLLRVEESPVGGLALCTTIVMLVAKAIILTIVIALCYSLRKEPDRKKSIRRTLGVVSLALCVWIVCIVPWLANYESSVRATTDRMIIKMRDYAQQKEWLVTDQLVSAPSQLWMESNGERWWRLDCTAWYRVQALWLICFPPAGPTEPQTQVANQSIARYQASSP